jgi:hypothetical protein
MSERHDIVLRQASGSTPNPPGLIDQVAAAVRDASTEPLDLTGDQLEQLQRAILSGFSASELERLVRTRINESLAEITSAGSLAQAVFELINWAERHGRTRELIRHIRQARPDNKAIQQVATALIARERAPSAEKDESAECDEGELAIQQVAAALLFGYGGPSGIQAKSAKAAEIRSLTTKKLRGLDQKRAELIRERDTRQPLELAIERANALAACLTAANELGIKINARIARKAIEATLRHIADPEDLYPLMGPETVP